MMSGVLLVRVVCLVSEMAVLLAWTVNVMANIGPEEAFSWHPIFMTLSFAICMTEGMLQFWTANATNISRQDAARKHAFLQVLSAICLLGGYLAIFISHYPDRLISPSTTLRKAHVAAGYTAIVLALVQIASGTQKYIELGRGTHVMRWHGSLGLVVHAMGMLAMFFAACFERDLLGASQVAVAVFIALILGLAHYTRLYLHAEPAPYVEDK